MDSVDSAAVASEEAAPEGVGEMMNDRRGRIGLGFAGRGLVALAALMLGSQLAGCGYNTLVSQKEAIGGQWSQVENQLQRRNDLIPNLVEVTKGYATHEKDVFDNIANSRPTPSSRGSRTNSPAPRTGSPPSGGATTTWSRRSTRR